MKHAVSILCLAVALSSRTAAAQPSLWDVAREPRSAFEYELLVEVEQMLDEGFFGSLGDPVLPQRGRAAAVLQAAGGARLSDPRLLYLYGDILTDESIDRPAEARRVLARMLRLDPRSPLAAHAWFSVAIASARLGDRKGELAAYTAALDGAWTRSLRATVLLNRAESKMMAGDLRGSIADYRGSVDLSRFAKERSLAHWGLAVALERYGDLPAALTEAEAAWRILPASVTSPGVFFVPAYEVHYYLGLAAMARAASRAPKRPKAAAMLYAEAAAAWRRYLDAAEGDDRWVEHARRHLDRCAREAAALDDARVSPARR